MRATLPVFILVAGACSPPPTVEVDAGVTDSGTRDAGLSDAGSLDAGPPDAGAPDAGVPDAGAPDAGPADAGAPDAGAPDAGAPDAGDPDAGPPDAGPQCVSDTQCPGGSLCTNNLCTLRSLQADGGFGCASACDCLHGEWCSAGGCVADPIVPTRYFKRGASGLGTSAQSPAENLASQLLAYSYDQVFALRANDAFTTSGSFEIKGRNMTVVGGYQECSLGRWVRDPSAQSMLATDGGTVLTAFGQNLAPLEDTRLQNLDLSSGGCGPAQVEAKYTLRLGVKKIRGGRWATTCTSTAVVLCDHCDEVSLDEVRLAPTALIPNALVVARLNLSAGVVRAAELEPQPGPVRSLELVEVNSPTGAVRVTDARLSTVVSLDAVLGIVVFGATAGAVTIDHNRLEWARRKNNGFVGIRITGSRGVQVLDNLIVDTGAPLGVAFDARGVGLEIRATGALVQGNTVRMPAFPGAGAGLGIYLDHPIPLVELTSNRIEGGDLGARGIFVEGSTGNARCHISGNSVDVRGSDSTALELSNIGSDSFVRDNDLAARMTVPCVGATATATVVGSSVVRIEGNRFTAEGAQTLAAVRLISTRDVELLSNHLSVAKGCGLPSVALRVETTTFPNFPPRIWVTGNTIDPRGFSSAGTVGIDCVGATPPTFFATGNIIGAGDAPNHVAVAANCAPPSAWASNYFWADHPAGLNSPFERAAFIVQADAGEFDVRGNIANGSTSCLADGGMTADGGPAPWRLRPGGPCVDTGRVLFTSDGGLIEFDLDGLSRLDAGLPDIGASELH